jgi:stage IV sporulation protein FB
MMFIYILLFFTGKNNFTIGLIALFIIISSLKEKERISYIIMSDIINKKGNFVKKGYMENRSMSIYYKKDLLAVLSMVDKNKYNIFTILDDEMKVMDIIYEEEIIEALKIYGNITIDEFIRKDNAG